MLSWLSLEELVNADAAFDVILMNIHMPVLDGIEASRRIRALPDKNKQAIPIIALTANILQDEKQKCF
ncbi:MAG: response regulator [Gammaproteobacteria bacterium]|nr:response regulator [Gammaproteobacteria bacterium]